MCRWCVSYEQFDLFKVTLHFICTISLGLHESQLFSIFHLGGHRPEPGPGLLLHRHVLQQRIHDGHPPRHPGWPGPAGLLRRLHGQEEQAGGVQPGPQEGGVLLLGHLHQRVLARHGGQCCGMSASGAEWWRLLSRVCLQQWISSVRLFFQFKRLIYPFIILEYNLKIHVKAVCFVQSKEALITCTAWSWMLDVLYL